MFYLNFSPKTKKGKEIITKKPKQPKRVGPFGFLRNPSPGDDVSTFLGSVSDKNDPVENDAAVSVDDPKFDPLAYRLNHQKECAGEKTNKKAPQSTRRKRRGRIKPQPDPFYLSGSLSSSASSWLKYDTDISEDNEVDINGSDFNDIGGDNNMCGWVSKNNLHPDLPTNISVVDHSNDDCTDDEDDDLLVGFGRVTTAPKKQSRSRTAPADMLEKFGEVSTAPSYGRNSRSTGETTTGGLPGRNRRLSGGQGDRHISTMGSSMSNLISHAEKGDILSQLERTSSSVLFSSAQTDIIRCSKSKDDSELVLLEGFNLPCDESRCSKSKVDSELDLLEGFNRRCGESRCSKSTVESDLDLLEGFNRPCGDDLLLEGFICTNDEDGESSVDEQQPPSSVPQSRPQQLIEDDPRRDQLMQFIHRELEAELKMMSDQSVVNLESSWADAEQHRVKVASLDSRITELRKQVFLARMARNTATSLHSDEFPGKKAPGRPLRGSSQSTSPPQSCSSVESRSSKHLSLEVDFNPPASNGNGNVEVDFRDDEKDWHSGLPHESEAYNLDNDGVEIAGDMMLRTITIQMPPLSQTVLGSSLPPQNNDAIGCGSIPRQLNDKTSLSGLEDYDFDPLMILGHEEEIENNDKSKSSAMRRKTVQTITSFKCLFENRNDCDNDDNSSISSAPNLFDITNPSEDLYLNNPGRLTQGKIGQKEIEIDGVESQLHCQKADLRQIKSDVVMLCDEAEEDDDRFNQTETTVRQQVEHVELQEMNVIAKLTYVETAQKEWLDKGRALTFILKEMNKRLNQQNLKTDLDSDWCRYHQEYISTKERSEMEIYDLMAEFRKLGIPNIRGESEDEDVSYDALTKVYDLRAVQEELVMTLLDDERLPCFQALHDLFDHNCQSVVRAYNQMEQLESDLQSHLAKLTALIDEKDGGTSMDDTTDSSTSSERWSLEVAFIESLLSLLESGRRQGRLLLDALTMSDKYLRNWGTLLGQNEDNVPSFVSKGSGTAQTATTLNDSVNSVKIEFLAIRSEVVDELERFQAELQELGIAILSLKNELPACSGGLDQFHQAMVEIFPQDELATNLDSRVGSAERIFFDKTSLLDKYTEILELTRSQAREQNESNLTELRGTEQELKNTCLELHRAIC